MTDLDAAYQARGREIERLTARVVHLERKNEKALASIAVIAHQHNARLGEPYDLSSQSEQRLSVSRGGSGKRDNADTLQAADQLVTVVSQFARDVRDWGAKAVVTPWLRGCAKTVLGFCAAYEAAREEDR